MKHIPVSHLVNSNFIMKTQGFGFKTEFITLKFEQETKQLSFCLLHTFLYSGITKTQYTIHNTHTNTYKNIPCNPYTCTVILKQELSRF